MTTHADLVAAAEKARPAVPILEDSRGRGYGLLSEKARNAHVDDLLAILRLHTPMAWGSRDTLYCEHEVELRWPCPTVQIVVDRLTSWGVL